ncbi:PIG-L family deacetylase [Streptomyces sp. NPDC093109]|uniref:PIG-L family deacetylase n=1 Tax=Streptomyces sp. NPDC093109 TaxID=3154977 RepID=UPI00344FEA34
MRALRGSRSPGRFLRASRVPAAVLAAVLVAVTIAPAGGAEGPGGCRRTLLGVAHPDDDLFFFNPEIERTLRAGCAVSTVYLTAGDGGERDPRRARNYVENRENGVRKAYAKMAGAENRWSRDPVRVKGHGIRSFRLTDSPVEVRLTFLRLHDGMPRGRQAQSMLRLFDGDKKEIVPFQGTDRYSEARLLEVLTSLVRRSGAERVLTQDHDNASFAFGVDGRVDHSDHGIGARYLRKAAYHAGIPVKSYLGYTMTPLKRNLTPRQAAAKERTVRWYDAQRKCPRTRVCGERPLYRGILTANYRKWLVRQYPQRHRGPASGEIMGDIGRTTESGGRAPERCLDVKDSALGAGVVRIFDCNGTTAQKWDIGSDGTIRTRLGAGHCLTRAGGDLRVLTCRGAAEGQKWRRVPWESPRWRREAWRIAGDDGRCLYQHDRTFPRKGEPDARNPRLGLARCDGPREPELYWRWRS